MALQVTKKRIFIYNKDGESIRLSDTEQVVSPEKVMEHYSSLYPELVSGRVDGPIFNENNEAEYTFSTVIGSKG